MPMVRCVLPHARHRRPLSIALLIGLGANALFGLWWMDPAAALVIAAVAIKEGGESWRGDGCCGTC
jgi:divalent metal cation (Fe/Co/Zn/Cd) transporter